VIDTQEFLGLSDSEAAVIAMEVHRHERVPEETH